MEIQTRPDRIVREPEVTALTGVSRTTRWRLVKDGKFPGPLKLSDSTVGWRESELQQWIATRRPKSSSSRSQRETEEIATGVVPAALKGMRRDRENVFNGALLAPVK